MVHMYDRQLPLVSPVIGFPSPMTVPEDPREYVSSADGGQVSEGFLDSGFYWLMSLFSTYVEIYWQLVGLGTGLAGFLVDRNDS